MKLGLRWSAKMRPETRKMAEEAARRSGLLLNDWLDSVIAHQAGQPRVSSPPLSDDAFHGGDLETVNYRLDRLSQRIDQMSGGGPAAYAPKRTREDIASAPPAAPRLPMPPSLERALVEIAARQRALGSHAAAPQPQTAAAPTPLQAQHLAGLEEQLRNLNSQIEILRKPGVEEAIQALREELGQIGKTLRDAMPRRELEAIERQIQALDRRIAESRQAGIDADALGGIEHGLAEIRDAVRGLMPAETLTGYTEEVANLARKIEVIVAQNDPATLAQLEQAVTTLREMSGHIASNDTVRGLAAQVHQLGDKIDAMAQMGGGAGEAAFGHLEQRIAMLSDALNERVHGGGLMSPRLEALLQQISEKIDGLHGVPGGGAGFGHLEDHIVKLVEKLDASDAHLGHLEGIERGLADLLVHFETARDGAQAPNADEDPAVLDLQLKIARTQDTLEAVHGTLGHVVERLATIEKDIREQPQTAAAPTVLAPAAQNPTFVEDAPSIAAPMTTPDGAIAPPAQRRLPTDPGLPDNQPLEPGSGRPHNPAARIAESEAALGDTAPVAPTAPSGGKSSFIAAARRAAQAANQQPSPQARRSDAIGVIQAKPSLRDKMMKRAKSLIIAASIIAIVVGSVQIAGNVFKWTNPFITLGDAISPTAETGTTDAVARTRKTARQDEPTTTGSIDARPVGPDSPPAIAPLAPPPMGNNVLATGPAPVSPLTPVSPSLFGPPILPPKDDVTGSIPPVTAIPATNPATSPALSVPPLGERLPPGIGGPKLRSAALAGDAAAAYAVAQRYAEGKGVPVNMEEAARWFERAASKGLVPAQFRYASLLEKGLGVKKDVAQARSLYLAAATKGNAKAMHNLAVLYAEGTDGKPDYAAAVQWFRKAAEHGVADSQYNLGVLYARGLGTEQNYAEAYKWFALAAAEGDGEAAKKRDEVAGRLDPATLAAAEKSVATFVATPQPPEAITVREPQGGWDHAASQPARGHTRSGPLALSAFQTGKP